MIRISPGQPHDNPSNMAKIAGSFRFPISQYLPDILAILMVMIIAYMFAGKPALDLKLSASPGGKPAQSGQSSDVVKKQPVPGVASQVNEDNADRELKARNIFTANGAYTDSDNKPIPANPYTLIGVTQGKETKAIFRDYGGSVVTMTVGQKMIDGSVITRIDGASVQLKKGEEKTELKAFDVPNREKTILRKP
jgi:hypothetical protein